VPSPRRLINASPGLQPSFASPVASGGSTLGVVVRGSVQRRHSSDSRRSAPGALAPVRVVLSRSINACRPHPPHSRARRDFPAGLVIRGAFAVPFGLGSLRVVPCFRCSFLVSMSSSYVPGQSTGCLLPACASCGLRLRPPSPWTRHCQHPHDPLHVGSPFRGFLVRLLATTCRLARPPLADLTELSAGWMSHCPLSPRVGAPLSVKPARAFTSELSASRSPFSLSDMTTVASGHLHRQDFHLLKLQLASLHRGRGEG
jgi:hypothetical protein